VAIHARTAGWTISSDHHEIYERGVLVPSRTGESLFVPWGRFVRWEETSSGGSEMVDRDAFIKDLAVSPDVVEDLIKDYEDDKEYRERFPDLPTLTLRGNGSRKVVISRFHKDYPEYREVVKRRVGDPKFDSDSFERRTEAAFRVWIPLGALGSLVTGFFVAFILMGLAGDLVGEGDWATFGVGMAFSVFIFLLVLLLATSELWAVPRGVMPHAVVLALTLPMLGAYALPLMLAGTEHFEETFSGLCLPAVLLPALGCLMAVMMRIWYIQRTVGRTSNGF
jgi:hypothetical protein